MLQPFRRTILAACLLLTATAAHAATAWECYVYNPLAKQPSVEAVIRMADEIKDKTNGDVVITVHLGGSLPIKADGITAAVTDNVIQIADDGFATGTIPITGVLRLPMLLQSSADLDKAMAIVAPYLDAAYGKRGIEVLGQYAYPVQVLWGRKKITSLADIKGFSPRSSISPNGKMPGEFCIRQAEAGDIPAVVELFREYAKSLDIDLAYQGFAAELASLPGAYAPPTGALLVAAPLGEGSLLGCVGLRALGHGMLAECEMKRLYVRPAARGTGAGLALAKAAIEAATEGGYAAIRLDSLPSMAAAQALYLRLGFTVTPAYYASPVAGTIFMRKDLRSG